jgi:lipopolysaccharide export system permease protein
VKTLDYYLAVTVSVTIGLVIFALVGIITLFSIMAEMEHISDTYGIMDVLAYIAYTTPRRFYDLIPFCTLIGCLLGLGVLSNNNELVVMRASGVSVLRISMGAMIPVVILGALGMAVGEYVVPDTERIAQVNRESAVMNRIASAFGFWYREGDVYMHFTRVEQGGSLVGVSHYEFDENRKLKQTLFAEKAIFHDPPGEASWWELQQVSLTTLAEDEILADQREKVRWDTTLDPDALRSEILVQPDKMSIQDLSTRIGYLQEQGLNSVPQQLAFWRKSLQPLATIGLVFIAITFIVGPLREVPMGVRIVAGMITGIVFKFLQDLLTPASMVFGFSPVLATAIPILLCFLFGVYLMRREL